MGIIRQALSFGRKRIPNFAIGPLRAIKRFGSGFFHSNAAFAGMLDVPDAVLKLEATIQLGKLPEVIKAALDDPKFKELEKFCRNWPTDSTVVSVERALMVWVIKATAAKHVLEIGTYFAGTTLALASAVYTVGEGEVHTIDPYGAERAPKLFAKWAPHLSKLIRFRAAYSCEFLLLMNVVPNFDLIFIDGNHAYPNVLHDLAASVLNAKPGAYLFVDNAEQPDVMTATLDFLKLNPAIEAVLVSSDGAATYRMEYIDREKTLDYCFALLRLPVSITVGSTFLTYHVFGLTIRRFSKLEVSFIAPCAGQLKVDYHLRSIAQDTNKESSFDLLECVSTKVSPGASVAGFVLRLEIPPETDGEANFAEFALSFSGDDPGARLLDVKFILDDREYLPGRNWFTGRAN